MARSDLTKLVGACPNLGNFEYALRTSGLYNGIVPVSETGILSALSCRRNTLRSLCLDFDKHSYLEKDNQAAWYGNEPTRDLRQFTKLECLAANILTILQ